MLMVYIGAEQGEDEKEAENIRDSHESSDEDAGDGDTDDGDSDAQIEYESDVEDDSMEEELDSEREDALGVNPDSDDDDDSPEQLSLGDATVRISEQGLHASGAINLVISVKNDELMACSGIDVDALCFKCHVADMKGIRAATTFAVTERTMRSAREYVIVDGTKRRLDKSCTCVEFAVSRISPWARHELHWYAYVLTSHLQALGETKETFRAQFKRSFNEALNCDEIAGLKYGKLATQNEIHLMISRFQDQLVHPMFSDMKILGLSYGMKEYSKRTNLYDFSVMLFETASLFDYPLRDCMSYDIACTYDNPCCVPCLTETFVADQFMSAGLRKYALFGFATSVNFAGHPSDPDRRYRYLYA